MSFFTIAHHCCKIFGLLLQGTLFARTFKNHPIWSHCYLPTSATRIIMNKSTRYLRLSLPLLFLNASVSCLLFYTLFALTIYHKLSASFFYSIYVCNWSSKRSPPIRWVSIVLVYCFFSNDFTGYLHSFFLNFPLFHPNFGLHLSFCSFQFPVFCAFSFSWISCISMLSFCILLVYLVLL